MTTKFVVVFLEWITPIGVCLSIPSHADTGGGVRARTLLLLAWHLNYNVHLVLFSAYGEGLVSILSRLI